MPLPTSRLRHRLQLGAAVAVAVGSVWITARFAKMRSHSCHAAAPIYAPLPPPLPATPSILPAVMPAGALLTLPPAFESALREGDVAALDRAYTKDTSLGLALQRAAKYGKKASVGWVLDHGAGVHFKENEADAPLLEGDAYPDVVALLRERGAEDTDLSVAAIAGAPNAVARILAAKGTANPNDGTTPLFDAVSSSLATAENKQRVVDLLLAAGADPNTVESGSGRTPLAAAVAVTDDDAARFALVRSLLGKQARVSGDALSAAFDLEENPAKGAMFDLLLGGKLEPGATALALSHATGESVAYVKKVAAHGVAWAWQDGEISPAAPLVDAVDRLDVTLTKALLDVGAPIDLQLKDGRCALGQAIDAFGSNALDAERVVDLLVTRGANVNKRFPDGRTPLFAAAETGDTRMLKALLDAGARVNERVLDDTPLDAAERSGNIPAARVLDGRGGRRAPRREVE